MAKLIVGSIQVDSNLNKNEIDQRGYSIGNKSIDGIISISFQSSGNMDDYLNKDGSLNRLKLLNSIYGILEQKGLNKTLEI